ncbi:MAG: ferrochelatase [Rhodoferax sp.]|uniref:ferrochelatase n=1 Tax=Rhodoferax sp. TaxID=50421 RepID=UPI00262A5D93|nr:ferrochelatase [Rhodoferax sp.]MDD5334931.1 ferrochelatase [Rhodoferax sp.]
MTSFLPEPSFTHGQVPRTAVLFCNLGTPDTPGTADVRRFLGQFLSDRRVVEIPRLLWWLILHGIILRFRPARSAAKYASIWTPEGSPLKVWTEKQARLLQDGLARRGHDVPVRYAMRYGSTAIAQQLDALKAEGCTRILILPAYPQYSATTTASLFDAVYLWTAKVRNLPELRFVNRYHDDPGYIKALSSNIQRHWAANGRADQLLLSFHGVPQRTLQLGDPYHCECFKTARLLAEHLGLTEAQYKVTFQSRLGRAQWLQPYTEPSLIALAQAGVKRVDVVCPGFTSDCLETLEEIAIEGRAAFLQAGGQQFRYIACLNDDPVWINALCELTEQHLAGWPTRATPTSQTLARSRAAALALGAKQ